MSPESCVIAKSGLNLYLIDTCYQKEPLYFIWLEGQFEEIRDETKEEWGGTVEEGWIYLPKREDSFYWKKKRDE